MLLSLTILFLFDDLIFYLLFKRVLGLEPSWFVKLGVGFIITLLNLGLAFLVVKSLNEKPQTGVEGMIGAVGIVERIAPPDIWVKVRGELWRATSKTPVQVGEKIAVHRLKGLSLEVERLETNSSGGDS